MTRYETSMGTGDPGARATDTKRHGGSANGPRRGDNPPLKLGLKLVPEAAAGALAAVAATATAAVAVVAAAAATATAAAVALMQQRRRASAVRGKKAPVSETWGQGV